VVLELLEMVIQDRYEIAVRYVQDVFDHTAAFWDSYYASGTFERLRR
jgi:hypothetical protein